MSSLFSTRHVKIDLNAEYKISNDDVTIYPTDMAWSIAPGYRNAELVLLAAKSGTKSKLQAILAQLGGKKTSVSAILPVPQTTWKLGREVETGIILPSRYTLKLPAGVSFTTKWVDDIPRRETNQVLYYPKASDTRDFAGTPTSEHFLVLPVNQTYEQRLQSIHLFLKYRLMVGILPQWVEDIWDFCLTTNLAHAFYSFGHAEVFSLYLSAVSQQKIYDKISRSLAEKQWFVPERRLPTT